MHFFVTKRICAHFFCRKHDLNAFFGENYLRTSSGKFLRVESCHPESSDFLGLCGGVEMMSTLKMMEILMLELMLMRMLILMLRFVLIMFKLMLCMKLTLRSF